MTTSKILKKLTAKIRKEKGVVEALNFYITFIQPIKEYFKDNKDIKK